MASTIYSYNLTGGRVFPVAFEYLARRFVRVTLVGSSRRELQLNVDYRFISKTEIETTIAWTQGEYQTIEIRRVTSATDRLVNFTDGSILRSQDLNISQIQAIHIAEEGRDVAENSLQANGIQWDALGLPIKNVGYPALPTDAANGQFVLDNIRTALRVVPSETIAEIPSDRANKVLAFDANRQPVAIIPSAGSSMALELSLRDSVDPLAGAAVLGRGVVSVDGIVDLHKQAKKTDLRFQVRGYHKDSLVGGGTFYWDPIVPRNFHNGGTIISPTVPWDGSAATLSQFLLGIGETSPTAQGAFVRTKTPYSVDCFGAYGGSYDDTASFMACDRGAQEIILTRKEYTVDIFLSTSASVFEIKSSNLAKLNVLSRINLNNKTRVLMHNIDLEFDKQTSIEVAGIQITACKDVTVTYNRMRRPWKTALSIWDCDGVDVSKNRIFDTGRGKQMNGIVPLGCGVIIYGCTDFSVVHNWCRDIWQIPVFVTGNVGHETVDGIVRGNMCRSSNDNGIRIQPDDLLRYTVRDVVVDGNLITGQHRADCLRVSGINILTTGNKLHGAGSTGIDAQYSKDSLIIGNHIYGCAEGIALTSYDNMTDNVMILENVIYDCFGNSAMITVSNDAASGGSFGHVRIAGNSLIKRAGVAGRTRGITVAMNASKGTERIIIENNDVDGYDAFGISCTNLNHVVIQGNTVGGVLTDSAGHIQVIGCATAIIGANKDRGPEAVLASSALRVAGANGLVSVIANVMPNTAVGLSISGTQTSFYRSSNHFAGSTPSAYTITGVGALRELTSASTLPQVISVLYTLIGDLAEDRYIKR